MKKSILFNNLLSLDIQDIEKKVKELKNDNIIAQQNISLLNN